MKYRILPLVLIAAACAPLPPVGQAYWQRVEDSSALYMTGYKAQQTLDDDIAKCSHEVKELVELDALRRTLPPDTHSDYHVALNKSGDLAYYDTPGAVGNKNVDHADYHDFESCMRTAGWERVKFVRYQTADGAKKNYRRSQQYRTTGLMSEAEDMMQDNISGADVKPDTTYAEFNK